jgi:hypothetical protein
MHQLVINNNVISTAPIIDPIYTRFVADYSFPTSPINNDVVYRLDNNRMFIYSDEIEDWYEISWVNYIKNLPEWVNNKLIIDTETGRLKITPNGTDWYHCIPVLGSSSIKIMTIDNSQFTYLYYILPGQTVTFTDSNHIPIVFYRDTNFQISIYTIASADISSLNLVPNNIMMTTYIAYYMKDDSTTTNASTTSSVGHYISLLQDSGRVAYTTLSLYINTDNHIISCVHNKYTSGAYAGLWIGTCHSVYNNAYWIGTLRSSSSSLNYQLVTVNYISVTRIS